MRRSEPFSELMPVLVIVMTEKCLRPAMPVMKRWSSCSVSSKDSRIIVPGLSGWFVLRMFRGMFFSRTGKIVPSWSTCAPM